MRSLGTRRAVLVGGAAAMTAVALAGCSAGQVAETSLERPSTMGINTSNADHTVLVRNLAVSFHGPAGYPSGAAAPIEGSLFNQSADAVTVTVSSSRPAQGNDPTVVTGTSVVLAGPAPSDSAVPPPGGAAGQPATITIAPMGAATFLPGNAQSLQLIGLTGALVPGRSAYLTFTFSNGAAPLTLPAPMAVPLTPGSRGPGIPDENSEG
jgi:hypothetical protein